MAIKFKEEALPDVSTFAFDITRWAGVNTIKGSQYDYEMADCKNMSSDNYPYASPRKPREKVFAENGIKRIYKIDDNKIYFIDSDNCLCYTEDGVKHNITYTDENGTEHNTKIPDCLCTNNYDKNTIFYPQITHLNEEGTLVSTRHKILFGNPIGPYQVTKKNSQYGTYDVVGMGMSMQGKVYIQNTNVPKFKITVEFPKEIYDGYNKILFPTNSDYENVFSINVEKYSKEDTFSGRQVISWRYGTDDRICSWELDFGILKEGDYLVLETSYSNNDNMNELSNRLQEYFTAVFDFIKCGNWYIEQFDNTCIGNPCDTPLDFGVVYNNRIVGVYKNQIRASALGDFTNFWEYADEAGNPSATGAYATDVGSAGDFTGICAYNNVLLLFKKDIVYEMYGSMPYTITELCTTGCIDNDSICQVDGVLYWASPKGIVRYSGGVPDVISTNIDIKNNGISKAGTDGRKYYVYDGEKIYVYDTYFRMWHIEDNKSVKMFYNQINDLYMVCDDGIYKVDSGKENVEWEFTTKDYTFYSKERKNLSKLWIRADMAQNTKLEVYVRQNGGEWTRVATKTAERDEMFDFKLRVKKCDSYTLKFKGKGDVRILDIHGKITVGTSKHRGGDSLNVYRR